MNELKPYLRRFALIYGGFMLIGVVIQLCSASTVTEFFDANLFKGFAFLGFFVAFCGTFGNGRIERRGIEINPASGLPMVGNVDTSGNPYGANNQTLPH